MCRGKELKLLREGSQRWTDEDLKETGNGFTFTTHFALCLTFGRGADVPLQRCGPPVEYGTRSARRISRFISHRDTDIQSILHSSEG